MKLALALVVIVTFALGITVFFAFYLVSGGRGLGPHVVESSWHLMYPLVALCALLVGLVVGRLAAGRLPATTLAVVFVGAWIGEYVVLASGILASPGELNPQIAVRYWLLATAGPVQPAAGFVGSWLATRPARARAARATPPAAGDRRSAE